VKREGAEVFFSVFVFGLGVEHASCYDSHLPGKREGGGEFSKLRGNGGPRIDG